ncbi:hypothetical protein MC7420_2655 [Coleofasciculus chthonoplastes PCC 7420]|uniref:Uncharacterized protein n=1 Tax=Coleofasciculus chthonoplastes PCC 7420 TaxID=118168 RepID=B4VYQ8_9CYAN|nr:hypothetical protein MC7420_2655 [Coleofasciculus chthonoplastes PCC 7420]
MSFVIRPLSRRWGSSQLNQNHNWIGAGLVPFG